jgi:hypothetical protein
MNADPCGSGSTLLVKNSLIIFQNINLTYRICWEGAKRRPYRLLIAERDGSAVVALLLTLAQQLRQLLLQLRQLLLLAAQLAPHLLPLVPHAAILVLASAAYLEFLL